MDEQKVNAAALEHIAKGGMNGLSFKEGALWAIEQNSALFEAQVKFIADQKRTIEFLERKVAALELEKGLPVA